MDIKLYDKIFLCERLPRFTILEGIVDLVENEPIGNVLKIYVHSIFHLLSIWPFVFVWVGMISIFVFKL